MNRPPHTSLAVRVALAGIGFAILLAPGLSAAEPLGFDPVTIYAVPMGDSPHRGPKDALITIVEFSDFACGYCNRAQALLEHVDRLFPGQVRWVFRHFPLDEESGTLAAEAAAAAALQGNFWPMHDRLFAVHGQVDRPAVELYASELGLDVARFRTDLDSGAARAIVLRDWTDGRRLGLSGTPTFFMNGRPMVGARVANFARLLDEERPRALATFAARPPDLYQALTAAGVPRADTNSPPPLALKLDLAATYRIGTGLPGHQLGRDDALVTVVMWSDFECPYCARMVDRLERLHQERADLVRIIYRHMPLANHRHADLAAEAAVVAARAGKFWPFYREVFAAMGTPLTRELLLDAARRADVDPHAVAAALSDHRYRDHVLADAAAASALGVGSTPTLFLNGVPITGAPPYDRLLAIVDERLAVARELVAQGVAPREVYRELGQRADIVEFGARMDLP